jgi:hypothetical protein
MPVIPALRKAEAGGLSVQGQSELHSKNFSQKKKKKIHNKIK